MRDALATVGFVSLVFGVAAVSSLGWAAIVGGGLVFGMASIGGVIDAIRTSGK